MAPPPVLFPYRSVFAFLATNMATTALPVTSVSTSKIVDAILEVRHELNPRFIDVRGKIAEDLRSALKLDGLAVGADGINLSSEDESEKAFVTVRNAGMEVHDAESQEAFAQRCNAMLRKLVSLKAYRDPNNLGIKRLGVRGRFVFEYAGSFQDLRSRLLDEFGTPSNGIMNALGGGKISDLQYVFIVNQESNSLNLTIGPMKDVQIVEFFQRDDEHFVPNVGLFVDIDVFKAVTGPTSEGQLYEYVRQFSSLMWGKATSIRDVVLNA